MSTFADFMEDRGLHLEHHGIKGMKWGVRRFDTNGDGRVDSASASGGGGGDVDDNNSSATTGATDQFYNMEDETLESIIKSKEGSLQKYMFASWGKIAEMKMDDAVYSMARKGQKLLASIGGENTPKPIAKAAFSLGELASRFKKEKAKDHAGFKKNAAAYESVNRTLQKAKSEKERRDAVKGAVRLRG